MGAGVADGPISGDLIVGRLLLCEIPSVSVAGGRPRGATPSAEITDATRRKVTASYQALRLTAPGILPVANSLGTRR